MHSEMERVCVRPATIAPISRRAGRRVRTLRCGAAKHPETSRQSVHGNCHRRTGAYACRTPCYIHRCRKSASRGPKSAPSPNQVGQGQCTQHHWVDWRPEISRSACFAPLLERSEEHTSELQSLMRISYAVFCLKKKNTV